MSRARPGGGDATTSGTEWSLIAATFSGAVAPVRSFEARISTAVVGEHGSALSAQPRDEINVLVAGCVLQRQGGASAGRACARAVPAQQAQGGDVDPAFGVRRSAADRVDREPGEPDRSGQLQELEVIGVLVELAVAVQRNEERASEGRLVLDRIPHAEGASPGDGGGSHADEEVRVIGETD